MASTAEDDERGDVVYDEDDDDDSDNGIDSDEEDDEIYGNEDRNPALNALPGSSTTPAPVPMPGRPMWLRLVPVHPGPVSLLAGIDQGLGAARALDESGAVIVLDDVVFLHRFTNLFRTPARSGVSPTAFDSAGAPTVSAACFHGWSNHVFRLFFHQPSFLATPHTTGLSVIAGIFVPIVGAAVMVVISYR